MNNITASFLFFVIFSFSSSSFSAEPDESGIGGTGINKPLLEDAVFSRPETPELADIPEIVEVPEFDAIRDGSTVIEDIEVPASITTD